MRFVEVGDPFKALFKVLRFRLAASYFLGNKHAVKVFFYSGAVYAAVLHLCYAV